MRQSKELLVEKVLPVDAALLVENLLLVDAALLVERSASRDYNNSQTVLPVDHAARENVLPLNLPNYSLTRRFLTNYFHQVMWYKLLLTNYFARIVSYLILVVSWA